MNLVKYLTANKAVSGPLEKNSSYSHLCNLRTLLLGLMLGEMNAYQLIFGSALHELFLEDKRDDAYKALLPHDKIKVEKMVVALRSHSIVMRLFKNSIREDKKYGSHKDLLNVVFAYILDMDQSKESTGSDLKSTACKTYADCAKKYIEYGYVKQGVLYKKLTKKKNFFFIFISKSAPYDIFVLNTADFSKDEVYAEKELRFLSYFYKKYGNLITEQTILYDKLKLEQQCQKLESKPLKKSKKLTRSTTKQVKNSSPQRRG